MLRRGESSKRYLMMKLIQVYKDSPCLWDPQDPHYKDIDREKEALLDLFPVYRQIYREATFNHLKTQLNQMRTSYINEEIKVKESIAAGENPVYTPKLWYFQYMTFLSGQEPVFEMQLNRSDMTDLIASVQDDENTVCLDKETLKAVHLEILQMYKERRCLWDISCMKYGQKNPVRKAYLEMLEVYRRIRPSAKISQMKKVLDNMRFSFRAESQKVKRSIAAGKEPYVPTLWYYNYIEFLDNNQLMKINDDDELIRLFDDYPELEVLKPTEEVQQIYIELLERYKECSCLWRKWGYSNKERDERLEAMASLLEIYKKIDDKATNDTLVERLRYMENIFKREMRKVKRSLAANSDMVYVPSLWYFNYMSFLDGDEVVFIHNEDSIEVTVLDSSINKPKTKPLFVVAKPDEKSVNVYKEIFKILEKRPWIWKETHYLYGTSDRKVIKAWTELHNIFRKIQPDVTRNRFKTHLKAMITKYKSEVQKIKQSVNQEQIYVSDVWFFNYLSFIGYNRIHSKNQDLVKVSIQEPVSYEITLNDTNSSDAAPSNVPVKRSVTEDFGPPSAKRTRDENHYVSEEIMPFRSSENSNSSEKSFASKLLSMNELTPQQRTIAEKLITQVINYGNQQKLTETSSIKLTDVPDIVWFSDKLID